MTLSKKTKEKLSHLFFYLHYRTATIENVCTWLREQKKWYLVPLPQSDGTWTIQVIKLGLLNTIDGKLNMFFISDGIPSYDLALYVGIDYMVDTMYESEQKMRDMTEEDFIKNEQELKKKGLA